MTSQYIRALLTSESPRLSTARWKHSPYELRKDGLGQSRRGVFSSCHSMLPSNTLLASCFLIFFFLSASLLYTHIYFCPQSHGFAVHAKRVLWIFWMKIELWEKEPGTKTGVSVGSPWFTGWAGRWVPALSWCSLPQHSPALTLHSWPLIIDDSKNTYSNGIPLPLEVHDYGLPSLQDTDPGMCTWVCVCVCMWQLELKMCYCDKIKAELRSPSSKASLMWLKVHWSPRRDTRG